MFFFNRDVGGEIVTVQIRIAGQLNFVNFVLLLFGDVINDGVVGLGSFEVGFDLDVKMTFAWKYDASAARPSSTDSSSTPAPWYTGRSDLRVQPQTCAP